MKKNKFLVLALILAAFFVVFGADSKKTKSVSKYISPNNDGIQDFLSVNFKIKDKSKIKAWSLVIEDSAGNVVRTIGNKVALPTVLNAKNFLKQLKSKKTSVDVPSEVIWNGVMENGETAPDGEYFYYITAMDERENATKTGRASVIVDNTPPQIALDVAQEGERVFGEGNKVKFRIGQEGSNEDKWIASFCDAAGNAVRNYVWENCAPKTIEWNGTDDNGLIVQDGVYKYTISATDRAGNTNVLTEVTNIIFSAEKPVTNVAVEGSRYFSVPEKSKKNSIKLNVKVPKPREDSGNYLTYWALEIVDSSQKVVRSYDSRKDEPVAPSEIIFDGKDDSKKQIADGQYFARVKAEYFNGYKPPIVESPIFILDSSAPVATIDGYDDIFSPDGDGNKDVFTLQQSAKKDGGAPVRNWQARILKSGTNESVFEYDFGSKIPPQEIVWNGLDKNGNLCSDGKYDYEIFADDLAGNSFSTKTSAAFTLDTSKTEIMLAANCAAFNPHGKRKDVAFANVLKSSSVSAYKFEIKNANNEVVFSKSGAGSVPEKIVWNGNDANGAPCLDGYYSASMEITSVNGSAARADSMPVLLDTIVPNVELKTEYSIFSPDEDNRKDVIKFVSENSTKEKIWSAQILDSKKNVVKTFEWEGFFAEAKNSAFEWDGSDDNENKVQDGVYSLVVKTEDLAGNSFEKKIEGIVLDSRPTSAYVTAALSGFSPVSQTGLTTQKLSLRISLNEGFENWKFEIENSEGRVVRTLGGGNATVPENFEWDGKNEAGKDCEGNFTAHFFASYLKGNLVSAKTPPFICSVTPPALSVKTAPEFFSPDNDGTDDDCFITLSGKTTSALSVWNFEIAYPESTGKAGAFWKTSGTEKITSQIIWDGLSNTNREKDGKAERVQSAMDYPYTFTATDRLGLSSTVTGVIPVDILVIREGDVLKMAVPSIIFRGNAADFKTAKEAAGSKVTEAQAANNVRVLKRVGEVLKKFPDYTVTVVGHANPTGTAGEGQILQSLSAQRAAFVKEWLTQNGGIPATRLASEGKGGSQPVASLSDTANWWKNRRVEFILHK